MRDSYRPMLKLALFGTYTLIAIGINEVRARLREARVPVAVNGPRKTIWKRRRARVSRAG